MTQIMDQEAIRRAIMRMAHEILEKAGARDLCLIGIRTRGVILAERLKAAIKDIEKADVPTGILDITMYRDDLGMGPGTKPVVRETLIDFDITAKRIVLVDDVFYTGRTIRAALDALTDFGRPGKIELAVLWTVDTVSFRFAPILWARTSPHRKAKVCRWY